MGVSRCSDCSVLFSSTRFTEEYINMKYNFNGCEEIVLNYINYQMMYEKFFRSIVKKIKKKKNIGKWLDFGCGKGYLLDIASKYNFNCYGMDVRKDFIKNDKIKFIRKNLFEAGFNDNEFDIITMINVLDHLGSPKKYLLKFNKLLKPNGILFIHVPNEHYALRKIYNTFTYAPHIHLVNYSEKNIKSILQRFNFSKVEFVAPKYPNIKNKLWQRLFLLFIEIYNKFAIILNKGIWPSMQLFVYK